MARAPRAVVSWRRAPSSQRRGRRSSSEQLGGRAAAEARRRGRPSAPRPAERRAHSRGRGSRTASGGGAPADLRPPDEVGRVGLAETVQGRCTLLLLELVEGLPDLLRLQHDVRTLGRPSRWRHRGWLGLGGLGRHWPASEHHQTRHLHLSTHSPRGHRGVPLRTAAV